MITSFEVGVLFGVKNEASPVLERIAAQFKELQGVIDKVQASLDTFGRGIPFKRMETGLAAISTQMKSITDSAAALGSNAMFAGMDKSITETTGFIRTLKDEIAGLRAEMSGVATSAGRLGRNVAGGIGAAGAGGAGAAAPRGGSTLRARTSAAQRATHPIGFAGYQAIGPGGLHARYGGDAASLATMGGLGIIGYGMYEEAQAEDAIFQMLYHTGEPSTPENKKKYRDVLQNAMATTGYPLGEIAAASKTELRMFKGTPGGGVDVLPDMIKAAAIESRVKGESLEESMRALIGLSHMTTEYGPEGIKKLAPVFAYLSAANPASLSGIERAAGYAVPILKSGLDIDPLETLLMGTVLTRAGATNSKSGTWLRNMMLNAMPGTSIMSKMAYERHEKSLEALGLVDSKGQPTFFTDGKPDPLKMLDIASVHAAAMPVTERAGYENALFGKQGFGAMALLANPAVRQQLDVMRLEMGSPEFRNRYGTFMEQYTQQSPVQQARATWGEAKDVMMDIGVVAMPAFVAGLHAIDSGLKAISGDLSSKGLAAIVAGLTGAAAGYKMGGWPGAIMGAATGIGAVGSLATSDSTNPLARGLNWAGIGGTIGAFGGSFIPGVGTVVGAGVGAAVGYTGGVLANVPWGVPLDNRNIVTPYNPNFDRGTPLGSNGPAFHSLASVLAGKQQFGAGGSGGGGGTVNANVSVSVKAETADPGGLAAQLAPLIAKILTNFLHMSNLNSQGGASGNLDAAHAAGTGAP